MRTLMALVSIIGLLGCDTHRSLGSNVGVHPTSPLSGSGTGAAGSTPTLTWTASQDADSYEVQVDNSCQLGTPCDFPSPEIDVMVSDPSYVPDTPLPVPASGPPRQTYCWRVRGCHQGDCGPWSDAHCFVVGADKTLNRDINGDGYGDLIVGAPEYNRDTQNGRVGVYLGGANLPRQPALTLEGQPFSLFGDHVALAGDLNGDGYGDYLVASEGDRNNLNDNGAAGQVRVFYGGQVLKKQPDVTFTGASQRCSMISVTGCGDLNNDGYDDLAFVELVSSSPGSTDPSTGWVEVHFGGPGLATAAPLVLSGVDAASLPAQVTAAGDVNGDGYPDLLVDVFSSTMSGNARALLFFGGPTMDAIPDAELAWPDSLGSLAAVGDVNGDGFADVAVGGVDGTLSSSESSVVYIFFGGSVPHTAPDITLSDTYPGEGFGTAVLPVGDLNNDGYADLAVLATGTSVLVTSSDGHSQTAVPYPGKVLLFAGGPAVASLPFATITAPSDHPYIFGGAAADLDGDGLPELLASQWNERGSGFETHTQIAIYRSSNGYATLARVLAGFKPGDDFGFAISQ